MNTKLEELASFGCDIKGALERILDDEDLLLDCISQVVIDEDFENLGIAIKQNDADSGFKSAHALKGITGNVGLSPLYDEICFIVEKLRDRKMTNLESLQPTYNHIISLKEQFEEILNK